MPEKVLWNQMEVELPPGMTEESLWKVNVKPGWDPTIGRWRDKSGTMTTETKLAASQRPDQVYGGFINRHLLPTPISDSLDRWEHVTGGISEEELTDLRKGLREDADPMPRVIENEMKRAQHFFWQEGDIAASFIVPLELTMQRLYVESESTELRELLNLAYGDEIGVDLRHKMYQSELCAAVYGQAFPVEIWLEKGKESHPIPENIIHIHPFDVRVGRQMARDNYDLRLPSPGKEWKEEHKQQLRPIESVLQPKWSEAFNAGKPIKLKPELVRPIRWHGLGWQRYVHPPLASMFRPITTRILVEEARRAIVEGYRQQFWVVQAGTPQERGTEPEIIHLRAQLDSLEGQRTATLVWNGNLQIEVVTPEALDGLINDELWLSLTLDIMRRRGISLSVISGESPTRGAGAGDAKLDISMLLNRLRFRRWIHMRWIAGLTRRIVGADAGNFWQRRAAWKTDIRTIIEPTPDEVAQQIEKTLEPLAALGKVSDRTLLRAANLDWETELRQKQEEEPTSYLFEAPMSFKQSATDQEGETTETRSQNRPRLVTDKNELKRKAAAALAFAQTEGEEPESEQEKANRFYADWLYFVWGLAGMEAEAAIDALTKDVDARMKVAAAMGYDYVGGERAVDPDWIIRGINFINAFAAGLEADWYDLSHARKLWRLGLYAQEGMRIGWVMGAQQAAKEVHAASHWRRILHPELSEAGPCIQCQEDATHLHGINIPFFEFHPNGVCSAQALAFYRTDIDEAAFIEIDIPIAGDLW